MANLPAKKNATTTLRSVRITAPMARGESLPSLTKAKGLRALLLIANQNNPEPGAVYECPLEALRDLLRCRDDEHLKTELEGLAGLKLNWHRFDPKARGYTIPVSSCTFKEGLVRFAFDPQFMEAWLDNRTGFRNITWEALQEMRSLHAAKLYELAAYNFEPNQIRRTAKISLEELRELFGVQKDQYPGGTFFQQVIQKAVTAINEGKYGFEVNYFREGRGASGRHYFEIRPAEEQKRIALVPVVKTNGSGSAAFIADQVKKALAALPAVRRKEVEERLAAQGLRDRPDDSNYAYARSYKAALYGEGVEFS